MDLIIKDQLFGPKEILDDYISLVWTDRMRVCGDFELKVSANHPLLSLFRTDYFIEAPSISDRTMFIETLSKDADTNILTITGRSLESGLEERVDATMFGNSAGSAPVADVMESIITTMASYVGIPGLAIGAKAAGTPTVSYLSDYTQATDVYTRLTKLANDNNVGWKLTRPSSGLQYSSYVGNNRTKNQTMNPWVVFDASLDNLAAVSYLTSSANYYNTAWVIDEYDAGGVFAYYITVYAPGYTPGVALGAFEQKVLMVPIPSGLNKADYSAGDWNTIKQVLGRQALADKNMVNLIDGKVLSTGEFEYGNHYFLGDIVSLGTDPATTRSVRVVEHIWTDDASGFKKFPTFETV